MAEPEILFDVDASKILAKLHLGALEAVKQWLSEGFFVNTGIKNDNPSAKPDNPGKVEFDLTNGEYEIGYVTTVDYAAKTALNSSIEQITPLLSKIKVVGESLIREEGESDDKPLLSKEKNEQKQQKRDEHAQKMDQNVQEIYKKVDEILVSQKDNLEKSGFKLDEIFDEYKKQSAALKNWIDKKNQTAKQNDRNAKPMSVDDLKFSKVFKSSIENNIKFMANPNIAKEFIEFLIKKLQVVAKASGNISPDRINKTDDEFKNDFENAFNGLQAYMNVFVGDKAKAIKDDNVVVQFVSSEVKDSNDKKLVANYEIVPADAKEIELQHKKNEANKDKATMKVCFKIGYSVQIDK